MSTPFIQTSFAAGELSPTLFAHVDLAKFHAGAALLRNFYVDYKGGASSRPGSHFVGKCKQAFGSGYPRVLPFQFSQTQTYALEFGHQYIRFITDDGYILETAENITAVTKDNPGVVTITAHGYSTGDWIFIQGVGGMTQLNGKTVVVTKISNNTFSMVDLWGNAVDTTNYTTYTSGGTASRIYTIASPYNIADLPTLRIKQSADVATLTHPSYSIYKLSRIAQTNWTMTATSFSATQAAPVAVSASPTTGGSTHFSYVVTAINSDTGEESIASNIVGCDSVDIGSTAGSITITWNAAANAGSYRVYKAAVGYGTSSTPAGSLFGLMAANIVGLQTIDGNINPDFTITPPLHQDPFAPGQIAGVTMTANGSGYPANTTASISTATGSGAVILPVIISGAVQGCIIANAGKNYANGDTISFSGSGGSGATATLSFGPATGTNPSNSAFFQQRQFFANTVNDPETFWATQTGIYSNMDFSTPSQDSDAISGTLTGAQVNGINDMVSMPTGLVILTGLGAWQITGGGAGTAVTPSTIEANAQAYNGCSPVVPSLTINYDIVYVQEKGSIVRDLSYNFFVNIYTGTDITVLASHLFTGYQITEWAWAEEPYKLVWATRNDGIFLILTYLKEQDVYAWTHADTFGLYRSVCSISEPPVNAVYYVVQRYINNQWVYYIERFDNRIWNAVEDVWAVDAGLQTAPTYPNANLTISAPTGTVTLTADAAVFSSGMVGQVIRTGGGIITLTHYTSTTVMTGTITQDITAVITDVNTNTKIPVPQPANSWSVWVPATQVSGLDHLLGCTVSILADGSVQTPRQVTTLSPGVVGINLDTQPVTKVTVGLGFQAQFQSMPSDTGQPTIQGRRKNLPAIGAILDKSRGIKIGNTFDDLIEVKERGNAIFAGNPIPLYSGYERVVIPSHWTVAGQFCVQQDYPLPTSILGVVPEMNVGDTPG